MSEWLNAHESAAYFWTGGAGVLGRLMYHARQAQQGKRKPLTWALMLDVPIALAMGWIVYGISAWYDLGPEPTISFAIIGAYLGPWAVDVVFSKVAERYFEKKD